MVLQALLNVFWSLEFHYIRTEKDSENHSEMMIISAKSLMFVDHQAIELVDQPPPCDRIQTNVVWYERNAVILIEQ